eukprot:Em0001g1514a
MGNRQPPTTNREASKDNSATVTASPPKAVPSVGNNNKGAISKPTKRGTGKKIIYSLNVTLRCTEDGSKREQELGLTWVPETVADLQDEIQDQFNIPVFDQKLKFGPNRTEQQRIDTVVQSEEWRQHNGGVHVRGRRRSDAGDGRLPCKRRLLSIESIEPQLILFPISTELQTSLRTEIDATQLDMFSTPFAPPNRPRDRSPTLSYS